MTPEESLLVKAINESIAIDVNFRSQKADVSAQMNLLAELRLEVIKRAAQRIAGE